MKTGCGDHKQSSRADTQSGPRKVGERGGAGREVVQEAGHLQSRGGRAPGGGHPCCRNEVDSHGTDVSRATE